VGTPSLGRRKDDRARERSAQRDRAAPCLRKPELRAEKRRDHNEAPGRGQEEIPEIRDGKPDSRSHARERENEGPLNRQRQDAG